MEEVESKITEVKSEHKPIKTTLTEKINYAFGNMGGYILWAFVGVYVTIYATDCIQPGENLLAVLGTVILVCRLCDGISDIIMGVVIEKTRSRFGKARFWFGVSIIPLTIVFFFMFFCSGIDKTASIVMISIMYFLFTTIFYTMNNVSYNAMLPRITEDPYDQSNTCTLNSIFTSIGSLITAFTVTILGFFGGTGSQNAWTIFVVILIAIAIATQLICFFKVKEKKEIQVEEKVRNKGDLKRGMKALFRTKYFYIAVLMFAINYFISLSVTSIGKYYAQYVLGNVNYFSLFGSLPMITMAIGLVLTPLLVKKLNKKLTLSIAIGFVAIGNIIGSIFPYSFAASLTGAMIKGLGSAVVMSQLFTLAPDIVRYISLKEDIRIEGLAASANSFGCKVGSGLGSAIVLWTLAYCGYVAESTTQTQSVINTFITLYWWVPMALSLVLLLLSCLWDIKKKSDILEKKKSGEIEENK